MECLFWTAVLALLFQLGKTWFTYDKSYLGFTTSALWPMSGVCAGLLIIRGWTLFPAVFFGRLFTTDVGREFFHWNWIDNYPYDLYWIYPAAYTLVALVAAGLYKKNMLKEQGFNDPRNVLRFFILVIPWAALVFPCIAIINLSRYFTQYPENLVTRLLISWSGNLLGLLIFIPFVLLVSGKLKLRAPHIPKYRIALLLIFLAASCLPFFMSFQNSAVFPIAFLPFVPLIWIAISLGLEWTVLSNALLTLALMRLNIMGLGPLVPGNNAMEAFQQLTVYIALLGINSLLIATIMDERRESLAKKVLLLRSANMMLWEWSSESGLRLWNKLTLDSPAYIPENEGFQKEECWKQKIHPDDFTKLPWTGNLSKKTEGEFLSTEVQLQHSGKTLHFLEITARIIKVNSVGKPLEMNGVIRDISDAKQARQLREDRERSDYELKRVRSAMNPHFLFNSLNVLKGLIRASPDKAEQALISISKLLRRSLRNTSRPLIPIGEELETVLSYLHLQKMRFEERLEFRIDMDPCASPLPIPPMILQHLVENAVHHGIENADPSIRGTIMIRIALRGGDLLIDVENPGVVSRKDAQNGLGHESIRLQLDSHYPGSLFLITDSTPGTVRASIIIPGIGSRSAQC